MGTDLGFEGGHALQRFIGRGQPHGGGDLALEGRDVGFLRLRLRFEIAEREHDRVGLVTVGQERHEVRDARFRAAETVPMPLNIAEGAGKSTRGDQRKYDVIARGSAMECGAIYDTALALKLVDDDTASRAEDFVTRIVGMLTKMCHFR